MARRAFTLVELLVVIAIIAVLIGLLLPAVQKVRESGNRTKCVNHMKNIALGVAQIESKYNGFPPYSLASVPPNQGSQGTLVHLLPFIEQDALYKAYDLSKDWNLQTAAVLEAQPAMFQCPSNPAPAQRSSAGHGVSDYAIVQYITNDSPSANTLGLLAKTYAINGDGRGLYDSDRRVRREEVVDGMSNTFCFVEDAGRPIEYGPSKNRIGMLGGSSVGAAWADPANPIGFHGYTFAGAPGGPCSMNCSNHNEIYSFHTNGAVFGFADGSVRYSPRHIDVKVMAALITRNGGNQEASVLGSLDF